MQVIVNADDLGHSRQVNEAVELAHHEGVLTSASLMVTGGAWEEAVELARRTPGLGVGLHLALADAWPALPRERVGLLVDGEGRLDGNPVRAGWRWWRDGRCRAELEAEVRAQFARFGETRLPLSHVDGHMQLHMHPCVFALVVELAERYGAQGVRIVREPMTLDVPGGRPREAMGRVASTAAAGWLGRWCGRRLGEAPLASAVRTFGLSRSGWMDAAYVQGVLTRTRASPIEIYFHPTVGRRVDGHGCNRGDLETLLDPGMREAVERFGWHLSRYGDLAAAGRAARC